MHKMVQEIVIERKTNEALKKLASKYSFRIVCGLLVGRTENNRVLVDDFRILPCATGPKIHFKPRMKEYRKTKEYIRKDLGKEIIGEFHTHPNGNEHLVERDKQIMKWIPGGLMFVVTPDNVVLWRYETSGKKEEIYRLSLRIESPHEN